MTKTMTIFAKKTRWFSVLLCLFPVAALAMNLEPLEDQEMSDIGGAGIAVALKDFRYMMDPTSYMEQVGSTPSANCTGSGGASSNTNCWRRGDLRWFGLSITGAENAAGGGTHWNDVTTCNPGAASIECPRGGPIGGSGGWFSPFDNPYLMRAWSPEGIDYFGATLNGTPSMPDTTIYEYLAPTDQPDYLFSFWGEIEAGATRDPTTQLLTAGTGVANGGGLLKSQTIIRGNAAGSIFRLFKFTETGGSPRYGETFSMFYHSRLQGDFRFGVAQSSTLNSDTPGVPVVFDDDEGLHFYNVDAFLPIGQLYYQSLVLDAVGTSGNFSLTLTGIPNTAAVYNEFYSFNTTEVLANTRGYATALDQVTNWNVACGTTACETYRETHGYVRYGDWYPGSSGTTRNAANASNDGIVFQACSTCSNFYAFAKRPIVIDKRGETYSRQRTQNYNCSSGNVGGCSSGPGPIVSASAGDYTRTYPTTTVNLGDARIEGMLIHELNLVSCTAGGC